MATQRELFTPADQRPLATVDLEKLVTLWPADDDTAAPDVVTVATLLGAVRAAPVIPQPSIIDFDHLAQPVRTAIDDAVVRGAIDENSLELITQGGRQFELALPGLTIEGPDGLLGATSSVVTLAFTGAGLTAIRSGNKVTVNVPMGTGGGGGGLTQQQILALVAGQTDVRQGRNFRAALRRIRALGSYTKPSEGGVGGILHDTGVALPATTPLAIVTVTPQGATPATFALSDLLDKPTVAGTATQGTVSNSERFRHSVSNEFVYIARGTNGNFFVSYGDLDPLTVAFSVNEYHIPLSVLPLPAAAEGMILEWQGGALVNVAKPTGGGGGNGSSTWLGLSDTPSSFTGEGGKYVRVKATEDELELTDLPVASGTQSGIIGPDEFERIANAITGDTLHDTPALAATTLAGDDAVLVDDASVTTGSELKEIAISELDKRWRNANAVELDTSGFTSGDEGDFPVYDTTNDWERGTFATSDIEPSFGGSAGEWSFKGYRDLATLPSGSLLASLDVGTMRFVANKGQYRVVNSTGPTATASVSNWTPTHDSGNDLYGFNSASQPAFGTRPTGLPTWITALFWDGDLLWIHAARGRFTRQGVIFEIGDETHHLTFEQDVAGTDNFFVAVASNPLTATPKTFSLHAVGNTPFVSSAKHWSLADPIAKAETFRNLTDTPSGPPTPDTYVTVDDDGNIVYTAPPRAGLVELADRSLAGISIQQSGVDGRSTLQQARTGAAGDFNLASPAGNGHGRIDVRITYTLNNKSNSAISFSNTQVSASNPAQDSISWLNWTFAADVDGAAVYTNTTRNGVLLNTTAVYQAGIVLGRLYFYLVKDSSSDLRLYVFYDGATSGFNFDVAIAAKIDFEPETAAVSGGGGLTQAAVDARVRAGVADWAETGNTDAIPAGKLTNAPSGGLDQSAVDARITAEVRAFARTDTGVASVRSGIVSAMDNPATNAQRLDYVDLKNKPDIPGTASDIAVVSSGFDGNLAPADNTLQKVAQKVDDLADVEGAAIQTTRLAIGYSGSQSYVSVGNNQNTDYQFNIGGSSTLTFSAAGKYRFYVPMSLASFNATTADNRAYLIARLEHVRGATVTTIGQDGGYMRGKRLGNNSTLNSVLISIATPTIDIQANDQIRLLLIRNRAQNASAIGARATLSTFDDLVNWLYYETSPRSGPKGDKGDQGDPGRGSTIEVQDEGTRLGADGAVTTVNFAGAGVTATRTGSVVTATIAGGASGASAFTGLSDTPTAYTGQGGKHVAVNAGANALEFVDAPGSGGGSRRGDLLATATPPATLPNAALGIAFTWEIASGKSSVVSARSNAFTQTVANMPSTQQGWWLEMENSAGTLRSYPTRLTVGVGARANVNPSISGTNIQAYIDMLYMFVQMTFSGFAMTRHNFEIFTMASTDRLKIYEWNE